MKRFSIAAAMIATLFLVQPAMAQDVAAIAGQPDTNMLEQWKADGVTTVINMRTGAEMDALDHDARAAAEALGLRYVSIPFDAAAAGPDIVSALGAALDGADGPVALHCASGTRAAHALAALRIARGEADPQALQSPSPDIRLQPSMMRALSPAYADAMSRAEPAN